MKRVKFQEDPAAGGSGGADVKRLKKHTLDSDEEDSSDEENAKQWVKSEFFQILAICINFFFIFWF